MDFLDPEKKRAQRIKLAIGHTLMVVLVLIGTYILVYQAYGFDVDRKTGQIIQNGLVFIDSAPDKAEIKIDGSPHKDLTNTRVALPEGIYDLEINKQGYRTWKKTFPLEGGFIERFTYPTLFPNDLSPQNIQEFSSSVDFMTQSPDRRWVLIGNHNNLGSLTEYDLNSLESERPVRDEITLPNNLFTSAEGDHSIKLVEWSTDNNNLLIKHTFGKSSEFVVVNRDKPEESFNVNKTIDQNPTKVTLRDKKVDQLYIYQAKNKALSTINVESLESETVSNNVITYETHGNDVVAMVVQDTQQKNRANLVVREGSETFTVREMVLNSAIKIAIARYDDNWYLAVYDPGEQKTYIYKNPVDFVKKQPDLKPAPTMVLRNIGTVDTLNFSQNTQFIAARSGQRFAVYDNEYGRTYNFKIDEQFDKGSEVVWMDGHRFLANSGGKVLVFEFDGQNKQTLVGAIGRLPAAFDRDYTDLYVIQSGQAKKPVFTQTFMRLEEDR